MSVSTTYRPETLVAHADRGIDPIGASGRGDSPMRTELLVYL